MLASLRNGRAAVSLIVTFLAVAVPWGASNAWGALEIVGFDEFPEGTVVREQYTSQGLRIPADPAGGPFVDNGEVLDFLLDTPPGLLSLNPFAAVGGPGVVHSSNGTYVFEFVDPDNPTVGAPTDHVEIVLIFADAGSYVMTAFDASGATLDAVTLDQSEYDFDLHRLVIESAGIRRVTLSTPPQPQIGALVDTIVFTRPAAAAPRAIAIDIRPGPSRNMIDLGRDLLVPVAILSEPGFAPADLDASQVRFQGASPVSYMKVDRNHDRVPDLVLTFRTSDLIGLTADSTTARLTAVAPDGTPLLGEDDVIVVERRQKPFSFQRRVVLPRTQVDGSS